MISQVKHQQEERLVDVEVLVQVQSNSIKSTLLSLTGLLDIKATLYCSGTLPAARVCTFYILRGFLIC